jgi:hypothetical protein
MPPAPHDTLPGAQLSRQDRGQPDPSVASPEQIDASALEHSPSAPCPQSPASAELADTLEGLPVSVGIALEGLLSSSSASAAGASLVTI